MGSRILYIQPLATVAVNHNYSKVHIAACCKPGPEKMPALIAESGKKRGAGRKEVVSDDQTMKSASEVHNND